ncbi:NAD(P)/FAD-dependent oxidoreductase [Bordetella bronchiseptica]|uniref:NAD(P)/FAD-dependent oxidoreductase n=1 Tax=Bordetella bronchiseptica TaxID=518 RepID=UPI00052907E7|nr:FAD-binding oxidoreductase [Bordetella bronchiseptica]
MEMGSMNKEIIVLGAGMVGVCAALHLQRRGHRVTLVDRREPGLETSYGNAGIIQREAVEPYAFPRGLATLLRVALRRGFDIRYHWGALPALLPRLAAYYAASAPRRYRPIALAYGQIIAHCTDEHQALIDASGCGDLIRRTGFRSLFRGAAGFAAATREARRLADECGVALKIESASDLEQAEPALRPGVSAGAIHWQEPWSVADPGALVAAYAQRFQAEGGTVLRGDAATLQRTGAGWSVQVDEPAGPARREAGHAVVALGPWSDGLLRRFGYRLPLFVKRGYHRHYQCAAMPSMPLQDADCGFVLSPMQRGLRLATGAELARQDAPPTPVQLARAETAARDLYALGEPAEPDFWMGSRPCTVDMLPVIGAAPRHPGLWFNLGHGHQGFTLGPVSGRLLAELVDGAPTVVDAAPYSPARFG